MFQRDKEPQIKSKDRSNSSRPRQKGIALPPESGTAIRTGDKDLGHAESSTASNTLIFTSRVAPNIMVIDTVPKGPSPTHTDTPNKKTEEEEWEEWFKEWEKDWEETTKMVKESVPWALKHAEIKNQTIGIVAAIANFRLDIAEERFKKYKEYLFTEKFILENDQVNENLKRVMHAKYGSRAERAVAESKERIYASLTGKVCSIQAINRKLTACRYKSEQKEWDGIDTGIVLDFSRSAYRKKYSLLTDFLKEFGLNLKDAISVADDFQLEHLFSKNHQVLIEHALEDRFYNTIFVVLDYRNRQSSYEQEKRIIWHLQQYYGDNMFLVILSHFVEDDHKEALNSDWIFEVFEGFDKQRILFHCKEYNDWVQEGENKDDVEKQKQYLHKKMLEVIKKMKPIQVGFINR